MIEDAAIRLNGKVWRLPRPKRHHDIIRMLAEMGDKTPIRGEQGFWDSKEGFVDRNRAYEIALECKQTDGATPVPGMLFSEDLW